MGKYDQYDPKIREVMELLDRQGDANAAPEDQEALEKEKEAGRLAAQRLAEQAEKEAVQDSVSVEYSMMMKFYDTLLEDYQRREAEDAAGQAAAQTEEHAGAGE